MESKVYLKKLLEEFHSATVATIGADGHPQTRVIDMMLWDDRGVYFLTAKGKEFYRQITEQQFIAVSATKGKASVSLRGKVKNIGSERLDEIFEKNVYMKEIYPDDTRTALEVFCVYEANGEYFDISDPSHVVRDGFVIGDTEAKQTGYFAGQGCIGCKLCYSVGPQKCIDISGKPYNLPCRYILHTVGPIIRGTPTKTDCELLAGCYRSCLELAAENGLESVAFCCIFTGEFHFPNDRAAQIAVSTVKDFMRQETSVKKVVFNVFKDLDKEIYRKLL